MGRDSHVSLLLFLSTTIELILMHIRHGGGPLVTGHEKMTSSYMNTAYSALTGLNVIIGLFSSMAVNMPDFGRFSKNRLAGKLQTSPVTPNMTAHAECLKVAINSSLYQ